jgi:hypothetical protein
MALNGNATLIASRGTVYFAEPGTAVPDYKTINPNLAPPAGWENVGHISRENPLALAKDGGEQEIKGSWWTAALRTTTTPTTWSVTLNSLQIDKQTLQTAFANGIHDGAEGSFTVTGDTTPANKAVLVLMIDGPLRAAFYFNNAAFTLGDAPEISVDNFMEIQLTAQVLVDGSGNLFTIYHPALEDAPVEP